MEPESGRFQHEAPFCEEPDAEVAAKVADDPGHARENRRVAGEPVPAHDGGVEPRVGLAAFELPLPELGPPLYQTHFQVDDLRALRSAIKERADSLGLRGRSLDDFVLVADELASNSVRHGGGSGQLILWARTPHAVCEVRDAGLITDPLVGRRRPGFRLEHGGAGLWTANQLCDLLLIHSTPASGTAVRGYLRAA